MKDFVLQAFENYPQLAIVISILLSVVVAVLGLVPSVFITGANILFFGFWPGTLISFIGETLGAAIAFFLYRKGFQKYTRRKTGSFPRIEKLLKAQGREAFFLILSLRLIPFVPSGLVTFAAAMGNAGVLVFIMASSLGKIPALLIEAYSVYEIARFGWEGKLILAITAIVILWFILRKIIRGKK